MRVDRELAVDDARARNMLVNARKHALTPLMFAAMSRDHNLAAKLLQDEAAPEVRTGNSSTG